MGLQHPDSPVQIRSAPLEKAWEINVSRVLFCLSRKLRSLLNKTLRGMRTRAKWIFVAKATALGARVPQAELFILVRIYKRQDENKVDAITAL